MDALIKAINDRQHVFFALDGVATSPLRPQYRSDGLLAFDGETGYLRVKANGTIDSKGGRNGPWTSFTAEAMPTHGHISLRSTKTGLYISIDPQSGLQISAAPRALALHLCDDDEEELALTLKRKSLSQTPVDPSVLSREDLQKFLKDGYIVLKGAVGH